MADSPWLTGSAGQPALLADDGQSVTGRWTDRRSSGTSAQADVAVDVPVVDDDDQVAQPVLLENGRPASPEDAAERRGGRSAWQDRSRPVGPAPVVLPETGATPAAAPAAASAAAPVAAAQARSGAWQARQDSGALDTSGRDSRTSGRASGSGRARPGGRSGAGGRSGSGGRSGADGAGPNATREPGSATGRAGRTGRQDPERTRSDQDVDPETLARQICLRQLELAPRTRAQLATKLDEREVPREVAEAVLSRFAEVGLIDDAAFAAAWVTARHNGRGLARRALTQELRHRGVDDEVVAEAVGALHPDTEMETARALVGRKLRATKGLDHQVRVRRLAGLLARKGYPAGVAFAVVREALAAEGADLEEEGPELESPELEGPDQD